MEVVEVPTLDAFMSRVSKWTITCSHPPPLLLFCCCFCQTSTTANTPSYRRQNNRYVECGPLNERRRGRSLSSFHLPRVSFGEQLLFICQGFHWESSSGDDMCDVVQNISQVHTAFGTLATHTFQWQSSWQGILASFDHFHIVHIPSRFVL